VKAPLIENNYKIHNSVKLYPLLIEYIIPASSEYKDNPLKIHKSI